MKKLICMITLVILLLCLWVPALAAEDLQLQVTADKSSASTGDEITFTFVLSGKEDAGLEGYSFHVDLSEGLEYVRASIPCSEEFQMSGYASDSNLVSAVIAKDSKGVSAEKLTVLTLTCKVTDAASGNQSVSVSQTLADGTDDEKWTLFDVDYHDLTCDLKGAYASIAVSGSASAGEGSSNAGESNNSAGQQNPSGQQGSGAETTAPASSANGSSGTSGSSSVSSNAAGNNGSSASSAGNQTASGENPPQNSVPSETAEAADNAQEENTSSTGVNSASSEDISDKESNDTELSGRIEHTILTEEAVQQESGNRQPVLYIAGAALLLMIVAGIVVVASRKKRY